MHALDKLTEMKCRYSLLTKKFSLNFKYLFLIVTHFLTDDRIYKPGEVAFVCRAIHF